MPYELFYERFPEIAEHETRTITTTHTMNLPDGEYGLLEAYCNEPGCDCRRVFFNVCNPQGQEPLAVIAYGWEDYEYYVKWFGKDDPRVIHELQGPVLNSASRQSRLAPILVDLVKWALQDKAYVERLKRHYKMFRESVDKAELKTIVQARAIKHTERNAPCPCGSGKKYKHCCGRYSQRDVHTGSFRQ